MDLFLGKVTQQAINYAIRSGVTLTATYAIRQSSKLLQNAPKSNVRDELVLLHQRLQHKIRIVSPAIDMIELIAARGNTSLESAVSLTKELRLEIQQLGQKLAQAAAATEEYALGSSRARANLQAQNEAQLRLVTESIKGLLAKIEDAVPLINLALASSGAKLSTHLPSTVSPSRLLQASHFLSTGDAQYSNSSHKIVQIGPTFKLTLYMLFAGHNRPQTEEEIRETTWKEVIHKARAKIRRVPLDVVMSTGSGSEAIPSTEITAPENPPSNQSQQSHVRADVHADEFAYQLMIVEDLDDDRIHDFDDEEAQPEPFDDVQLAGIREMIPIHEVSKIFYADTSKVLNIGSDAESNHPVLLLRRDVDAVPPRRMVAKEDLESEDKDESDGQPLMVEKQRDHVQNDKTDRKVDPWRLPPSLDPEWIAFEVYTEPEVSDNDSAEGEDDAPLKQSTSRTETPQIEQSMADLSINSPLPNSGSQVSFNDEARSSIKGATSQQPRGPEITTSLSLLELLLRLTSLQQFQQQSHLSITDELLNFFLEESASTGAGGDEDHRQAVRADARRRVGWDPYDESPLKRRGEDYQYQRPYQAFHDAQEFDEESHGASRSPSQYGIGTPSPGNLRSSSATRSPLGGAQTRSVTGSPGDSGYGPSSSPRATPTTYSGQGFSSTTQNRSEWLRRKESERKNSPLRNSTGGSKGGVDLVQDGSGGYSES